MDLGFSRHVFLKRYFTITRLSVQIRDTFLIPTEGEKNIRRRGEGVNHISFKIFFDIVNKFFARE